MPLEPSLESANPSKYHPLKDDMGISGATAHIRFDTSAKYFEAAAIFSGLRGCRETRPIARLGGQHRHHPGRQRVSVAKTPTWWRIESAHKITSDPGSRSRRKDSLGF
jgi:hypothetical protein